LGFAFGAASGCDSSGNGGSGETHFLCEGDADCAKHEPYTACVDGECRRPAESPDGSSPANTEDAGDAGDAAQRRDSGEPPDTDCPQGTPRDTTGYPEDPARGCVDTSRP